MSADRRPWWRRRTTPPGVHPTFASADLDARFRRDGYVVLDLFSPEEVAAVGAQVDALYPGERRDVCHRSNESTDLGYRRELHRLIGGLLDPVVERLLVDHRTISTGTLVKWKGDNSLMPVHQDWTMVDESRFRSLSFWVPLCDVDRHNGALSVLPGSHRVLDGHRPNPGRPPSLPDPIGGVEPLDLEVVPMRVGSCLVFDHGVLHGSAPNTLDEPRTAMVLAAAPRSAQLLHLWRRPDDVIERYDVADPEFFRFCTPGLAPDHPAITLREALPFRPHAPGAAEWIRDRRVGAGAGSATPEAHLE